jgi:hypothetical protein
MGHGCGALRAAKDSSEAISYTSPIEEEEVRGKYPAKSVTFIRRPVGIASVSALSKGFFKPSSFYYFVTENKSHFIKAFSFSIFENSSVELKLFFPKRNSTRIYEYLNDINAFVEQSLSSGITEFSVSTPEKVSRLFNSIVTSNDIEDIADSISSITMAIDESKSRRRYLSV